MFRKCRILLIFQASIFGLMMILTLLRVVISNEEIRGTMIIQSVWYLCAIVVFALSFPIAKNAVCIKCGKSILLENMDSIWNTIPLFQILAGQKPLCSQCKKHRQNYDASNASKDENDKNK